MPDLLARSPITSIVITALRRLMLGWAAVFVVVSLVTYLIAPDVLVPSMLIAIASLIISVGALLPGWKLSQSENASATPTDHYLGTIVAAMAIRVVGTVALFLLCRYEMGLPPQTIAFFVCGWYVLLTSFEVSLLARAAKSLTKNTESN